MTSCSSLDERLSLIHSLTMAKTGRHGATRFKDFWRIDLCPLYPPKTNIRRDWSVREGPTAVDIRQRSWRMTIKVSSLR